MSDVVGQIALELDVDPKAFKKQLIGMTDSVKVQTKGLTSSLGSFGKTALAAFSVKAVADFGKECLSLGSDLEEVQNVVDVTFKTMSGAVNDWASNAKEQFGISKTVAKQYIGQFGAMSKAVGNTEQLAYDQATALVGLAGDAASFYNKSVDESMAKLKGVFSGETEGLKEFGVVMTQTALDEFALKSGFDKTTASMTEQEKVALRLAFVQNALSDASGDYARTSDGWANQVKNLSLSFDDVKASLGQGLIVALKPALGMLNELMAYLQAAADSFARFMQALFGAETSGGDLASSTASAADSSGRMADNADKTVKSANKLKKALAPFDDFNILGSSEKDSDSSLSLVNSVSAPSVTVPQPKLPALDTAEFDISIENVKAKLKDFGVVELMESFGDFGKMLAETLPPAAAPLLAILGDISFALGTEIVTGLSDLTGSFGEFVGTSLPIASNAFKVFYDTGLAPIIDWLSVKIGDAFDFASGIFDDWTQWFADNEQAIYDMNAELGELIDFLWELIEPLADAIWSTFKDIIQHVSDIFQDLFTWVIENKDVVVAALAGVIAALVAYKTALGISTLIDVFKKAVSLAGDTAKIAAAKQAILNAVMNANPIAIVVAAITGLVAAVIYLWNTNDEFREFVLNLWSTIKTKFSEFCGWLKEKFSDIGQWFSDLWSDIKSGASAVGQWFSGLWSDIKSVASEISSWLQENVFDPIGESFSSLWDGMKGMINGMLGGIESFVNYIIGAVNSLVDAINSISFDVPDWVPGIGGEKFGFGLSHVGEISIPRLATGGYVAANSPRLAIIGDNKREGEIVAPESKISEAVAIGVAAAMREVLALLRGSSTSNTQPTQIIIKIGEHEFWSGFIDYHNDIVVRTGESPLFV